MKNSDRSFVKSILGEMGFANRFTVRTVGFEGTIKKVVTIKDWSPHPDADRVKERLMGRGYLVVFTTTQGIQA